MGGRLIHGSSYKYCIQWIVIYLLVSAIHWITQKVLEVLLSLKSALSAEKFPTKYTQGLALCTFSTKPLPPPDNELVMPLCVIMAVSNILNNNNSFFCFCLKGNCRHKCQKRKRKEEITSAWAGETSFTDSEFMLEGLSVFAYSVWIYCEKMQNNSEVRWQKIHAESRVGTVVRALASHQRGPGSVPWPTIIHRLGLLVLYSALRGFSPGTPVFSSTKKTTFDLIWFVVNQFDL